MLRLTIVVLCAAALANADVDNSGSYNSVQTSYGPPPTPVQTAYGPPPVQTSYGAPVAGSAPANYEPHRYEPLGYGVEPSYESDSVFSGPLGALVGYKLGAVGLVVKALGWVVVHAWAVILGAVATFAFCKVTAVCDLTYHKLAAEHLHEQVRSLVTPERLATASKFLDRAIEKYAPEKNKSA